MGSFNISGVMSKLTITEGDDVVVFTLVSTDYIFSKYDPKNKRAQISPDNHLNSNEGISVLFSPFFLPVFAKYSDSGHFENIVKDDNVKYIEDFFAISIEDFLDILTKGSENTVKDDNKKELLNAISLTYEHDSIYKKMISFSENSNNAFDNSVLNEFVIKKWGFELIDLPTGDNCRTLYYKNPNIEGIAMFDNDGSGYPTIMDTNKHTEINSIFDSKKLMEALNFRNIKYNSKIITDLKNMSVFDVDFKNAILISKKNQKMIDEVKKSCSKDIDLFDDLIYSGANWISHRSSLKYTLDINMEKATTDFMKFENAMNSTNTIYNQTVCLEQTVNHNANDFLANASLSYIKNKEK